MTISFLNYAFNIDNSKQYIHIVCNDIPNAVHVWDSSFFSLTNYIEDYENVYTWWLTNTCSYVYSGYNQ